MIADLATYPSTPRTLDHKLTPQDMVGMMRDGYSIGVPFDTVEPIADLLRPLLDATERLAFKQQCDEMMDIYIFAK